jgi:hypothetical protein
VAADFFIIEAWTLGGLARFLVLFFIDLSSRRVEIAGLARQANRLWMSQVARNLTDAAEGFLVGKRYLIHDRDPLFTAEFLETLAASGMQSVKLPPRSPNLLAPGHGFSASSVKSYEPIEVRTEGGGAPNGPPHFGVFATGYNLSCAERPPPSTGKVIQLAALLFDPRLSSIFRIS